MEHTEEQLQTYREEFAKYQQTRLVVTVLIVVCAGALALFTSMNRSRQTDIIAVSVFGALMLVAVVFLLRTSRCPACGCMVGRPMRAKFCDQCGVPLR